MSLDWRPSHAYVPGQTERHDEDLFDPLKAGVGSVPYTQLDRTRAWAFGWAFMRDGFFWEAHEMFEAIWMACAPNSPEKMMVQAIIQAANARLKDRMDRHGAAERLRAEARRLAEEAENRAGGPVFGVTAQEVQNNAQIDGIAPENA